MKEDWKECKLGDVCENIYSGGTPATMIKEYWNGELPWLSSGETGQRYINFTEKTITKLGAEKSSTRFAYKNSTVVASAGQGYTRGQASYLNIDTFVNQSVIVLKPNIEMINSKFLYFNIDSRYDELRQLSDGTSTRGSLSGKIMKELSITLPPLVTQQKIAQILSSLDDKIELNNKINDNLEQQAQAIFKSWFVDFEPFGGKMPEGWRVENIYSIANIIYGAPFSSKLFNTEKNGKPIIRIRDLKEQNSEVYTPEERTDGYLIQPKDIVVGMDGEFRPYIWGSEPGWLNQRVCVFENKRPKGKSFLFFSIKPLLNVVEKTQVATTVIHIGKKDFDKFQIILPTEKVLDKFDELTEPLINQIVSNRLENRNLTSLRDTLLPKLMSGEIDVDSVQI